MRELNSRAHTSITGSRRSRTTLLLIVLVSLTYYLSTIYHLPYSVTSTSVYSPIFVTKADLAQGIYHKPNDNGRRMKATFLTVCSNADLWKVLETAQNVEDRFNKRYHYDWVFLSYDTFTTEFKQLTSSVISGEVHYGLISKDEWKFPEHVDPELSFQARSKLEEAGIPDGSSLEYRHRARYWLKFFASHEALKPYDFFWRIEPNMKLTCDVTYDVFRFMKENNKKYGFILGTRENAKTMPTIWNATSKFIDQHRDLLPKDSISRFVTSTSPDGGNQYSTCSFWTNFEIGDLTFFRSQPYQTYAHSMDLTGGIYYERWGDAPLRTIGVSLLLGLKDLHFFTDLGYYYPDYTVCPMEKDVRLHNRCICDQKQSVTWSGKFCTHKYFLVNELTRPEEWKQNMNQHLGI